MERLRNCSDGRSIKKVVVAGRALVQNRKTRIEENQPKMEPSELADTIAAFCVVQNVTFSYTLLKHEVKHPFLLEWILNKRGLSVLATLLWNALYAVAVIWLSRQFIATEPHRYDTWMRVAAIFYFTFPASVLIWTYDAERPKSV